MSLAWSVKLVMDKTQEYSRPTIPTLEFSKGMSEEEVFQNAVVRPVIKMLHDLLLAYFKHFIATKKLQFSQLSEKEKTNFIESSFHKDIAFRNEIRGLVIGHFSTAEFLLYAAMQHEINRSINTILKERISSNRESLLE
ncbi:glyoxalase [Cyclobacterium jeungdonense]|uniref:Glyoxalase n=1 Tax=Cyclobacterium jeungdonense TaxID=708087 RepID=A0ABT8C3C7_9BACT|nr:glyoxalase [Cyclobacterium jeungdonense]MDN3686587.1 hypothetical protein [Cyclobacterium jeungdonense]